ncbi:MAG: hypothetical protein FJZ66_08070 [Bacteroidetes bacterium]|nr:hypothetical protein [Bacteroidota bacterium]
MTIYMQSLRNKARRNVALKLSQHRALGTLSKLSVFEVAALMDKLRNSGKLEEDQDCVFLSLAMN